jgi:ABC-2 type transport system permease protein
MKIILAIARRELEEYFATPLGWVCLFCFMGITGLFFADSVELLPELFYAHAMSNPFAANLDIYNKLFLPSHFQRTIVLLIFICPAVSMRLFSADMREGSFELLLSSPVSSLQIVLGKYLGALGFLSVLLAGTLPQLVILEWMGHPDPAVMGGGLLASLLVGSAYMAVGMVMSAFTHEQLLAGVLSFAILIAMLVLNQWDPSGPESITTDLQTGEQVLHWLKLTLSKASIHGHMRDMIRGVLNLSDLVYFASFLSLAVATASWRIESKRWS